VLTLVSALARTFAMPAFANSETGPTGALSTPETPMPRTRADALTVPTPGTTTEPLVLPRSNSTASTPRWGVIVAPTKILPAVSLVSTLVAPVVSMR
jgi:hypothetical protein